jgi:hypothetical protein
MTIKIAFPLYLRNINCIKPLGGRKSLEEVGSLKYSPTAFCTAIPLLRLETIMTSAGKTRRRGIKGGGTELTFSSAI